MGEKDEKQQRFMVSNNSSEAKSPLAATSPSSPSSPCRSRSASTLEAAPRGSCITSPPSAAALRDAQRRAGNMTSLHHSSSPNRKLGQKVRPMSLPAPTAGKCRHVLRCEPLKELLFPTSKHVVSC